MQILRKSICFALHPPKKKQTVRENKMEMAMEGRSLFLFRSFDWAGDRCKITAAPEASRWPVAIRQSPSAGALPMSETMASDHSRTHVSGKKNNLVEHALLLCLYKCWCFFFKHLVQHDNDGRMLNNCMFRTP